MATIKIPFNPENHDEFVALRNRLHAEQRLGGSDIGTANGQNKFKSRRRFYEEMVGNIPVPDISNKQSIKDGILCEDLVARKFAERTGKSVHRVNAILVNETVPHLFASIDRKVENEDAGLECKTTNALNWDAFKDGKLPDSYVRQVKTYMKVTGYDTWYAYVWVMGCAEYCYIFTTREMEKPEWCDTLVRVTEMELDECEEIAERWFADHIVPRVAPECDGSADESDVLKELFPEATESEPIVLTKITEEDLDELTRLKEDVKALEAGIDTLENIIKDEMGPHAEAVVGGRKVTFKNNKASSKTDWKAVAADCNPSEEVVKAHTEVKPGARVLRIGKAR